RPGAGAAGRPARRRTALPDPERPRRLPEARPDPKDHPAMTMLALRIEAPRRAALASVPVPVPGPGEVLVHPSLVGLCGTDLEMLHGTASYLLDGRTSYPVVI